MDKEGLMLYDAVELAKPRFTKDGYLVGEARVARTGIQLYIASELGLDGDPTKVIRVYRPPEEVFATDAMVSYAHRPITDEHPPKMVDAESWKKVSRGQTGDEVMRDGDVVRVPVMLMDAEIINAWKGGKKELSMGYTMDLDMTAGVTDSGEQYDAVQRNLRMNHLALVARARGGSQLRLGDGYVEEPQMETKLKTVTVDGLAVETTEPGAQAIAKLQDDKARLKGDMEKAATDHAAALAAKDKELAEKDAEIDVLKGKVLDEAALDAEVKKRADLIAVAKQIANKDYTGKSADEICKTAVIAKLGAAVVDGKSAEYIQARFDILADEAAQDPMRRVLQQGGGAQPAANAVDKAYDGHVHYLETAYQQKEAS